MLLSVKEIADCIGGRVFNAEVLGPRLESIRVGRPVPLSVSRPSDLAFFFSKAYQSELATADPGVLVTAEPFAKALESAGLPFWSKSAILVCRDPAAAMALLSEKFAAVLSSVAHIPSREKHRGLPPQIHPTAIVDPSAKLANDVVVGPYCVIDEGVILGAGTILYPHCILGPRCSVGQDCVLFPHVTLYEWTVLGDRVRLHAGAVLGSDGFGYTPKFDGKQVTGHLKIYHLGRVVVGDDVEMGATTCVDRGTFGDTRIEKNAKIDNQVHLAHNTMVDEGAILCGAVGVAGSSTIGKYAYVGGLVGITNNVRIGDGAKVGAMSLVSKDVPAGDSIVGNPQRNRIEHFRAHALLNKLLVERKGSK